MRTLALSGLVLSFAAIPGVALAAGDSAKKLPILPFAPVAGVTFPSEPLAAAPVPLQQVPARVAVSAPAIPAVAPVAAAPTQGWTGAASAPGSYRRPVAGYQLPAYWTQPQFYIGNYNAYGFREPAPGFGWSRYYDDAVITDSSGRVYDAVSGVDWNRPAGAGIDDRDRHDDGDRHHKRHGLGGALTGIGGALIGGAIGAVAGNLIGGDGNRLAGSLIGGGVGALAGIAVEGATHKNRHHQSDDRDDRYGDRRYDDRPHWGRGGGYDYGYRGGYNYGCCQQPTVITLQSEPVTTTSTRTYYETVRVPVYHRVWRPVHRRVIHRRQQCITGS
jgi:Ni/Co efflux regulator RcnB